MQLVLQLSRDCNYACRYCYQRHRAGPGMTPATAERAIRSFLEAGHRHLALTWFGGEPLLERGVIEELQPRLEAIGAEYRALVTAKIATNGALLDESFAAFARRHALFISLSLDGAPASQEEGRPDRSGASSAAAAERALGHLIAARTPFATYSVVTPANARALGDNAAWLFERGSRVLVTSIDFGGDWNDRALRDLERGYLSLARHYERWTRRGQEFFLAPFDSKIAAHTRLAGSPERCAAGAHQFAVDPEGFLYPCIEFLEHEDHRIGHVDEGVDSERQRALNARIGGDRPEACFDCGINERCASSCACLNFRLGGAMRRVDALLCAHERAVTLAADRLGRRMFEKRLPAFLDRHYEPKHPALRALEGLLQEARR